MEQQLEERDATINTLRIRCEDAVGQNTALKVGYENIESRMKRQNLQISTLQAKNDELKLDNEAKQNTILALQEEIEAVEGNFREVETEFAKFKEDVSSAENGDASTLALIDQLQSELDAMQNDFSNLGDAYATVRNDYTSLSVSNVFKALKNSKLMCSWNKWKVAMNREKMVENRWTRAFGVLKKKQLQMVWKKLKLHTHTKRGQRNGLVRVYNKYESRIKRIGLQRWRGFAHNRVVMTRAITRLTENSYLRKVQFVFLKWNEQKSIWKSYERGVLALQTLLVRKLTERSLVKLKTLVAKKRYHIILQLYNCKKRSIQLEVKLCWNRWVCQVEHQKLKFEVEERRINAVRQLQRIWKRLERCTVRDSFSIWMRYIHEDKEEKSRCTMEQLVVKKIYYFKRHVLQLNLRRCWIIWQRVSQDFKNKQVLLFKFIVRKNRSYLRQALAIMSLHVKNESPLSKSAILKLSRFGSLMYRQLYERYLQQAWGKLQLGRYCHPRARLAKVYTVTTRSDFVKVATAWKVWTKNTSAAILPKSRNPVIRKLISRRYYFTLRSAWTRLTGNIHWEICESKAYTRRVVLTKLETHIRRLYNKLLLQGWESLRNQAKRERNLITRKTVLRLDHYSQRFIRQNLQTAWKKLFSASFGMVRHVHLISSHYDKIRRGLLGEALKIWRVQAMKLTESHRLCESYITLKGNRQVRILFKVWARRSVLNKFKLRRLANLQIQRCRNNLYCAISRWKLHTTREAIHKKEARSYGIAAFTSEASRDTDPRASSMSVSSIASTSSFSHNKVIISPGTMTFVDESKSEQQFNLPSSHPDIEILDSEVTVSSDVLDLDFGTQSTARIATQIAPTTIVSVVTATLPSTSDEKDIDDDIEIEGFAMSTINKGEAIYKVIVGAAHIICRKTLWKWRYFSATATIMQTFKRQKLRRAVYISYKLVLKRAWTAFVSIQTNEVTKSLRKQITSTSMKLSKTMKELQTLQGIHSECSAVASEARNLTLTTWSLRKQLTVSRDDVKKITESFKSTRSMLLVATATAIHKRTIRKYWSKWLLLTKQLTVSQLGKSLTVLMEAINKWRYCRVQPAFRRWVKLAYMERALGKPRTSILLLLNDRSKLDGVSTKLVTLPEELPKSKTNLPPLIVPVGQKVDLPSEEFKEYDYPFNGDHDSPYSIPSRSLPPGSAARQRLATFRQYVPPKLFTSNYYSPSNSSTTSIVSIASGGSRCSNPYCKLPSCRANM